MADDLDTSQVKDWRSIVTLIVFVVTNIVVLFPFHVPIFVPRLLLAASQDGFSFLRVTSPRQSHSQRVGGSAGPKGDRDGRPKIFVQLSEDSAQPTKTTARLDKLSKRLNKISTRMDRMFVRLNFPMNFVTAPLIADLFLLAISAIGAREVHDGTIGANNIFPLDIMAFFLTLAYIAISIDASGLIRYLAFKVLQKAGEHGRRLYFYLYVFFFGLACFIGNDPIVLSGTAFLAYMTRVSRNIRHPRAWIFTQFTVANIGSAILVSSNPTNLVLAGAFDIKFIKYTANVIVPVIVTAIVLFPFLLYIIFPKESEIPRSIKLRDYPEGGQTAQGERRKPQNPNIPYVRANNEREESKLEDGEQGKRLSLEEIMNPFLDKGSAAFGALIMATTLITIITLNAVSDSSSEHPVYWVTLPAAFVMFCWDVAFGWIHRGVTRSIAREGREKANEAEKEARKAARQHEGQDARSAPEPIVTQVHATQEKEHRATGLRDETLGPLVTNANEGTTPVHDDSARKPDEQEHVTLTSHLKDAYIWLQETFPTATAVMAHLPFALVPFALSMFVLVQALVTKGWVPVFAHGWDRWVHKTGTIGAIGGMGFLSVIMCNFAGTNIGTTILLCRVIQAWVDIHQKNGTPITQRTFWATVYSMALGVNYGAFSTAFSASLAGLLWRDILHRKHINVRRLEFARVNIKIIAVAMAVGCAVLAGEVYIIRDRSPYKG